MRRRTGPSRDGRPWTETEDEAVREAASETMRHGLKPVGFDRRAYANRLAAVADRLDRSYDATLKRAQRIGARSYPDASYRD